MNESSVGWKSEVIYVTSICTFSSMSKLWLMFPKKKIVIIPGKYGSSQSMGHQSISTGQYGSVRVKSPLDCITSLALYIHF